MSTPARRFRMGSVLAVAGLALSFLLSLYLKDATPFTVVAPICIGGKWAENVMERRHSQAPEGA